MGATGFLTEQTSRRRRSILLLAGTFAVLWTAANLLTVPAHIQQRCDTSTAAGNNLCADSINLNWAVLAATTVAVAAYLAVAYYASGKAALAMAGAKPAGPDHTQYVNIVEEISLAAGIKTPKAYVIVDPAPNAFATGRNADHAAVSVTTGLLDTMNRAELEGVVAHEIAHIANKDIAISTLAVLATAATAFLADIAMRAAFTVRGKNTEGLRLALFAASIALYLFAIPAGMLLKAGLSRNREGLADATAVEYTRSPAGLRSALEKMEADTSVVTKATAATAHLWIESPLDRSGARGMLGRLLDTHPPLAERIATLRSFEGLDPNGRGNHAT